MILTPCSTDQIIFFIVFYYNGFFSNVEYVSMSNIIYRYILCNYLFGKDVASKWFRVCIYKLTKLLSYCAYKANRYTKILLYQAVMCLWWYTIFTSLKCVFLYFLRKLIVIHTLDKNLHHPQHDLPSTMSFYYHFLRTLWW